MTKSKYEIKVVSYGIYDGWDSKSKELPKIIKFTEEVPAKIDIEFGMVVNIKKAKGKSIHWCIEHPGILDAQGEVREPFEGSERIKSADWHFFLGDTIWAPVADKIGNWHLRIELEGQAIAEKTFSLVQNTWADIW